MSPQKKKQKRSDKALRSNWLPLTLVGVVALGMVVLMGRSIYRESENQARTAAEKTLYRQEFSGLEEANSLPAERKSRIIEAANREFCPCKCGYTLASCLVADRRCRIRSKNLSRVKELIDAAAAPL